MTNVLVTTTCPHGCAFCFASDLAGTTGSTPISAASFERCLNAIRDGGGDEVRLVGGEPTTHPKLDKLVGAALDRGLKVTVFSGGLVDRRSEEILAATPESRVTVVFNVNAAAARGDTTRLATTIDRIAPRAALAVTVNRLPWATRALELLARRPTLRRPVRVRVGIAHPNRSGTNHWLRPAAYPEVARRLAALAHRLAADGATVEFDCGFVRCAFDGTAMARLRSSGAVLRFECRPVVDLTPGGTALHCLALGDRFARPHGGNVAEIRAWMHEARRGFDEVGVFHECSSCAWRSAGDCDGGCLAVRLRRFRWTNHLPIHGREGRRIS